MPQIPRGADVNRRIASGQQRVSSVDTSQSGRGLMRIAGAVEEFADSRTRYQLSQAKTEFLRAKTVQDSAYDNDEDFTTISDRYNNSMQTALEQSSKLITDPRARSLFEEDAGLQALQGSTRIQSIAYAKETDHQRGYIDGALKDMTEAAHTGDISAIQANVNELVDNGVDMNWLSAEEAEAMKTKWRDDTFLAKVQAMEPEDRIEALQQPFADKVPTEMKVGLMREAEALLVDKQAMNITDDLLANGADDRANFNTINQIEDEKVREATEKRYNVEIQRRRTLSAEEATEDLNQYFSLIRDPANAMTVAMIPKDERDNMDPATLDALYRAENAARTRVATTSSPLVQQQLHDLNTIAENTGDYTQLREFLNQSRENLSAADNNRWSEIASKTLGADPEIKSFLTDQQYVINRMDRAFGNTPTGGGTRGANARNERAPMVTEALAEWDKYRNTYQANNNGKVPDPDVRDAFIDRFVMDRTFEKPSFFGFSTKEVTMPWIQMDDDQRMEYLNAEAQSSPQNMAAFQQALSSVGSDDLNNLREAYELLTEQ